MAWNLPTLLTTLDELRSFGDDTTLIECKRAAGGMPTSLGESLSAFANMPDGGTILLGIDQHSGFQVTGVEDPAQMRKKVADFCRQTVKPSPQLEFIDIPTDRGIVVAVDVSPLLPRFKPALYSGKPYLRQADGDYVMNANDLRLIEMSALHESENKDCDLKIYAGTNTKLLDQELTKKMLTAIRGRPTRRGKVQDDDLLLQITNVTDDHGNLRLAGLYALGYVPQALEPSLSATAAVRLSHKDSGRRTKNLTDLEGPLPDLVDQALDWIQHNVDTITEYDDDGRLVNRSEFPLPALREIVTNAFVHRDLGPSLAAGKRVEIRITDRALIIQNPGGLKGLSVAQLESKELTKAAVNQRLYEIAKFLETRDGKRVIEGEGGGIRKALLAMKYARMRPPTFIDSGTQFTVIFHRGGRFSRREEDWLASLGMKLSPPQEDLLVGLFRGERYSVSRLYSDYDAVPREDLAAQVQTLIDAGVVKQCEDEILLTRKTAEFLEKPSTHQPAPDQVPDESMKKLGKNVEKVLRAIEHSEGLSLHELLAETELTVNQVRYALKPLLERHLVEMNGGQGKRKMIYRQVRK